MGDCCMENKGDYMNLPDYVAKMQVSVEKKEALLFATFQFEEKNFLPSIGSVRYFCETFDEVNLVKSPSRSAMIPRIFKFLASLEADEIYKLVQDGGHFSGPAKLGPIADAIRNFKRRE